MKSVAITLGIVILFLMNAGAQSSYIDSLKMELAGTPTTGLYFKLAEAYRYNDHYEDAVATGKRYVALADAQKDNLEKTKAYGVLTHIRLNMGDYKLAQQYLDSAALTAGMSKDPLAKDYALLARAVFYYNIDKDDVLVTLCQQILKDVEPSGKDPFLMAKCYYYLYTVYTTYNDFPKSLYYAGKAAASALAAGDQNLLSSAYSALAVVYPYRYDKEKKQADLDSTMYYSRAAGDLFFQYPGKVAYHTYALARMNLSSYYLKYYPVNDPQIRRALTDTLESVLRFAATGLTDNQDVIASCYGILGTLAKRANDFGQAAQYYLQAKQTLDKAAKPFYHTRNTLLSDMAALYAAEGNYAKAYELEKELLDNNTKLFDEDQALMVNKLEAQYQAEKKEQEVQVLKDKARSQQKAQHLYFGLAGIGLLGAFFMFRSYHFNLKYSVEREKKLKAEQHDAQTRLRLQEEERARLKAEQELLELQQLKLRDEIMMSQLQVQHKNELLLHLKEKLKDEQPVNMQQIIREEDLLDGDFEKAKFSIQEVHPNFFKQVHERAAQKLTSLDLKYCAYLYLGMDTKQIAGLLHVEPKSVRMTKYRLKQKFDLDKETDLVVFLKGIA
ncbi:LuxR C-terminal-related transcriptional regulator [Niabella sp.]|uniref:helix-turn-helix transcriptional regulator n=1 Tax=Niabella sp. TaxID=1962976 RepID=UPI002623B5A4|nr:LuxR C-terminal-related transcriptional regulator [Niabella sp.]